MSKKNRLIDLITSPLTFIAAYSFRYFRKENGSNMPITKKILLKKGVFPVIDHYYEPLFNTSRHLTRSLREERNLPGIDLNQTEQLAILQSFHYNEELLQFPVDRNNEAGFWYRNGVFESGDAEYLYNMIRQFKPRKLIEIGSGYSTLLAINAIKQNNKDDAQYGCAHICIEPYENEWLKKTSVQLIQQKAETLGASFFQQLGENDILFIDSSHIIRPQGDVLFLYAEVLPLLKSGVIVHIHDIFTPRDYPDRWIKEENRFWNEQYLLEAFLCMNRQFRVIGALNYLTHHHKEALSARCPIFAAEKEREPGSFWIVKN